MDKGKHTAFRQGIATGIALAVLTGIEFGVAFIPPLWPVLVALALIKVGLVLQNFMHLPRVFRLEGGH